MYNDMNLIIDNKDVKISLMVKILFMILIILIVFSCIYKVQVFDNYIACVIESDGDYYVQVYMENNSSKFISNNEILIDNKKYNYEIINIDNNDRYIVINIKTNLDKKYLVNNNYINISQKNMSDSLFNIIIKRIKKGMNL